KSIDRRPPPDWSKAAKKPSWAAPPGQRGRHYSLLERRFGGHNLAGRPPFSKYASRYRSTTQKNRDSYLNRGIADWLFCRSIEKDLPRILCGLFRNSAPARNSLGTMAESTRSSVESRSLGRKASLTWR